MSGETDDDFRKQLELEEREKRILENSDASEDPYTYTDKSDGTTYEWNHEKQAWFPKLSEDFLAAYQASYGQQYEQTVEKSSSVEAQAPDQDTGQAEASSSTGQQQTGEKRKAEEQPPGWFEVADEHNTNVYVSNLPNDITDEEFVELMSKCGIIMKDPENGKLKMKLYRDYSGQLKGDGRCCYMKGRRI